MIRYLVAMSFLTLSACGRIDAIPWQPDTAPHQWCEAMPCVELFSSGIVLDQPSSTVLVYLLGAMWLWAGWRFWRTENGQLSRRWWAIAILLGGLAAMAAGTSYQAFGYELKCAGRDLCVWTSWWEIAYLAIQSGSMNAMLAGVAYACTTGALRRSLLAYSALNLAAHLSVIAIGAYLPDKFLISFEMLVLFSTPTFLLYFVVNGWGYFRGKDAKDLVLLRSWLLLTVINALYYIYLLQGYTQLLWQSGVWFSANDVLHALMLLWVYYVGTAVVSAVEDAHGGKIRN